jgi:hypothetical protein
MVFQIIKKQFTFCPFRLLYRTAPDEKACFTIIMDFIGNTPNSTFQLKAPFLDAVFVFKKFHCYFFAQRVAHFQFHIHHPFALVTHNLHRHFPVPACFQPWAFASSFRFVYSVVIKPTPQSQHIIAVVVKAIGSKILAPVATIGGKCGGSGLVTFARARVCGSLRFIMSPTVVCFTH